MTFATSSALVIALAGGAWAFLGFLVFAVIAVLFVLTTRAGQEMYFHSWGKRGGDAPGALGTGNIGKDRTVDVRNWTRGTSARPSRRHRPDPKPAATLDTVDPALREELAEWRKHIGAERNSLVMAPDVRRDHVLGNETAPLQLVGYVDFECPSCRAASGVIDGVQKRLGDRLLVVIRHFPIADAHPMAPRAAEASEAAAAQGRFWEMLRGLYASRRPPTPASLHEQAARLRLDLARFEADLESRVYSPRILEDFTSGARSGVNGIPTLFLNGRRYDGDHTVDAIVVGLEDGW
jgi:predicted DsbA family dithiol-disulfide isomerase